MFKPKHLITSGKFIEHRLTRDKSGEVWMYEMPDVTLNLHDSIEYWIYAEKSNLGYFTQHILAVQGKNFQFNEMCRELRVYRIYLEL
jgi:hypothetical protein